MQSEKESFELGVYGIPSADERARKSPEQLAILLSQQKPGSPAYILVEHELNMRLAKIQANATEKAAWVGVVGVVAGVVLALLLPAISAPTAKSDKPKPAISTESKQNAPVGEKP